MEVFIYGKTNQRKQVKDHLASNRPKIWSDATGLIFLKVGNVEIELTTQDINRLSRASERAGAAAEA